MNLIVCERRLVGTQSVERENLDGYQQEVAIRFVRGTVSRRKRQSRRPMSFTSCSGARDDECQPRCRGNSADCLLPHLDGADELRAK